MIKWCVIFLNFEGREKINEQEVCSLDAVNHVDVDYSAGRLREERRT